MRLLRIAALGLLGMVAMETMAADGARTLTPAHTRAKVTCHDCHQKENPTAAAVADEGCMVCHGDYPAMKAQTKDAKPNPHGSPHDPIPCTECHRQHKPPVVKCLECHQGKYTFNVK